jgi:hypothetical protein
MAAFLLAISLAVLLAERRRTCSPGKASAAPPPLPAAAVPFWPDLSAKSKPLWDAGAPAARPAPAQAATPSGSCLTFVRKSPGLASLARYLALYQAPYLAQHQALHQAQHQALHFWPAFLAGFSGRHIGLGI